MTHDDCGMRGEPLRRVDVMAVQRYNCRRSVATRAAPSLAGQSRCTISASSRNRHSRLIPSSRATARATSRRLSSGRATGSVHTGLSINELAPGGVLHPHVHSFEEGFYILSGEAVMVIDDEPYQLRPGDYGAVKVGTSHAWRAPAPRPCAGCRWRRRSRSRTGAERDTFFPKGARRRRRSAPPLDLTNLRGNLLGPLRRRADSAGRSSGRTCSRVSRACSSSG